MERISKDRLRTESQWTCSANHHSHCAEFAFLAISNTHLISSELAQDDEFHSGFNLDSPLGRGAYRGGSGRWRLMVATARPKVRAYPVAQSMRPCRAALSAEFPPKLSTIAAPLLPASFQVVTPRSSISNAPAATMPKNSPLPMPLFRPPLQLPAAIMRPERVPRSPPARPRIPFVGRWSLTLSAILTKAAKEPASIFRII